MLTLVPTTFTAIVPDPVQHMPKAGHELGSLNQLHCILSKNSSAVSDALLLLEFLSKHISARSPTMQAGAQKESKDPTWTGQSKSEKPIGGHLRCIRQEDLRTSNFQETTSQYRPN